jgi:F-type H+-transporting ATPase subunit delta
MDRLAALRYGKALFDVAKESSNIEKYQAAALLVLNLLTEDDEFASVLNHPSIGREQKMALVSQILAERVPIDFIGLFDLVLRRGREDVLPDIMRHFSVLYMEHKRLAKATLYAAAELPPAKITEIREVVAKKINKYVDIETIIDESLIAGFRIEVDGFVFDASVKRQMELLTKSLHSSHV